VGGTWLSNILLYGKRWFGRSAQCGRRHQGHPEPFTSARQKRGRRFWKRPWRQPHELTSTSIGGIDVIRTAEARVIAHELHPRYHHAVDEQLDDFAPTQAVLPVLAEAVLHG
jgi:hypothetical protein